MNEYVASQDARDGSIPIVEFGSARPINYGAGRTFYAPNVEIVAWVDREQIPAFAQHDPVCPLPAAKTVPPLLTQALNKKLAAPRPKRSLRDALDDSIPEDL